MHESVFHLCPRGHGPTSYRLYEALQADTIPIYIWEHVRNLKLLRGSLDPDSLGRGAIHGFISRTTACTRYCKPPPFLSHPHLGVRVWEIGGA